MPTVAVNALVSNGPLLCERLISKSQLDGKIAPIHRFRSGGAGRGILQPTALDDPLRPSTDIVGEGALQVADALVMPA